MATLAELYEFLETKQDDSHLDSRFSYDAFLPVEQPKARLDIDLVTGCLLRPLVLASSMLGLRVSASIAFWNGLLRAITPCSSCHTFYGLFPVSRPDRIILINVLINLRSTGNLNIHGCWSCSSLTIRL